MSKFIWLIFLDKDIPMEEIFADIDIPFDCEFLVTQLKGDSVEILEVYRVKAKLPLQIYRFGNWSPEGGLDLSVASFYDRRNNLQGVDLLTGARKV